MAKGNMDPQKLATFNAALGAVIRINRNLDYLDNCRISQDAYNWYYRLEAIRMEVFPKVSKQKMDEIDELFEQIWNEINSWTRKSNKNRTIGISTTTRRKLLLLEQELRNEADKADMLIPNKKDIMDMIGADL